MAERPIRKEPTVADSLKAIVFASWLNLLLVFIPVRAFVLLSAAAHPILTLVISGWLGTALYRSKRHEYVLRPIVCLALGPRLSLCKVQSLKLACLCSRLCLHISRSVWGSNSWTVTTQLTVQNLDVQPSSRLRSFLDSVQKSSLSESVRLLAAVRFPQRKLNCGA